MFLVNPPAATGPAPGADPETIEDTMLRAEYEAAIEENRQKIEKYAEQYELRKWLKRFPRNAERYIIGAYSTRPFDTMELSGLLEQYEIDKDTRTRILDSVARKIKELE